MKVAALLINCHGWMANATTATMNGPRRSLTHLGSRHWRSIEPVIAHPAV